MKKKIRSIEELRSSMQGHKIDVLIFGISTLFGLGGSLYLFFSALILSQLGIFVMFITALSLIVFVSSYNFWLSFAIIIGQRKIMLELKKKTP